ncbi:MAG: AAA family ATPase, partial [Candidatus Nomurabacteria bacterium]|nr:AAA family ATPase [Candidatus Nomurabacteria bacterium]
MTKIIVLRGNVGSGKSTIAKDLFEKLGGEKKVLIVSHDDLNRKVLPYFDHEINAPHVRNIISEIMQVAQKIDWQYIIFDGIWRWWYYD